jgi:hypothetical protein
MDHFQTILSYTALLSTGYLIYKKINHDEFNEWEEQCIDATLTIYFLHICFKNKFN